MKCRGCGRVGGNGKDVEGLGWMHYECEVNRLTHALEESESLLARAEAERDIADKQLSALCEGVNRRCGADNNQLPLVSLDRIVAENERLTQQVANGRMEADRLLKVVFARDAKLAAAEEAMKAVASLPGENWLTGQLALAEFLDGKGGKHLQYALVMYEVANGGRDE